MTKKWGFYSCSGPLTSTMTSLLGQTNKKSNRILAFCFSCAFKAELLFSVFCSTIQGEGWKGDFKYAKSSLHTYLNTLRYSKHMGKGERRFWYSKHMETATVVPLILLFQNESQREISSFATSDTSCHFILGGKACRRVLNALLVPGTVWLLEEGTQRGRKTRLQREDRLRVIFALMCVFPFQWHPLAHYQELPKGISTQFFPKCLRTHQAPAGWLLFRQVLRSLVTNPLFPATKFFTCSANEKVFVENSLYQPWWDKPSWKPR